MRRGLQEQLAIIWRNVLRIHALGGLSVHRDGCALTGTAAQPRRLAVIALVARAGERGLTRDKLLATLWPDADDERGRRSLSQTLYGIRQDLGSDDAILGLKDLRLNTDLVSCDVVEFETAMGARDLERAVELYAGPFADGFHVPKAAEFEQWVETERRTLAHSFETALERLAAAATARGDYPMAVAWLRRLAAHDPLNARVALLLMQALEAAGDPAGAVRHARVYELLIEQELDLPPDRDVVTFASRLRRALEEDAIAAAAEEDAVPSTTTAAASIASSTAPAPRETEVTAAVALATRDAPAVYDAAPSSIAPSAPPKAGQIPLAEPAQRATSAAPAPQATPSLTTEPARLGTPGVYGARRTSRAMIAGIAAIALVLIAAVALWRRPQSAPASDATARVVAVGRITDYRTAGASGFAAPLADMLATNLARAEGVQVLSTVRLYELARRAGDAPDSSGTALAMAARDGGATELIDGALYDMTNGNLRLDLRRIDLATGDVRGAYTVSGREMFALADSGTARLVAELGAVGPSGSIADVTTRSLKAYQLYDEGLRASSRGDAVAAARAFEAAVAEDSMFAMAVYYSSLELTDQRADEQARRMARAERLASHATDRERLIILAGHASSVGDPAVLAYADTLARRYPNEVYGPLYMGVTHVAEGEYLRAIPLLERVITMDSLALQGARAFCSACIAFRHLISAYESLDSLDAAERTARRWLRLQPASGPAHSAVADVLDARSRPAEALDVARAIKQIDLGYNDILTFAAEHYMIAGDFASADRLLREQMQSGITKQEVVARWQLAVSLYNQGRLREALEEGRRWRVADERATGPALRRTSVGIVAQVLSEMGAYRESAALFDSVARSHVPFEAPTAAVQRKSWMLTHAAGVRVAAGDTVGLEAIADTIRTLGATTASGRHRRLHHYVLGLLLAARGDSARAELELRAAIHSPSLGYTRTNLELGRLMLARGRPRDAIGILQAALRGRIEGANMYVSRTELHELLARVWDAAGGRDSAATRYRAVTSGWAQADPRFAERVQAARMRLAALGGG
jgi:DNA-binding SARP family transcriptional activator